MSKTRPLLALAILLVVSLACNALVREAVPTPTLVVIVEPTSPPTASDLPLTEAGVPRVPLEVALTAYSAGAAVFVDVRGKPSYDLSHIPGALYIPLGEFETNLANIDLPKDQWIITYCT